MEHKAFKLIKNQNRRPPPKRGQIMKKILKDWFGSAGGKRRRNGLVSRDGKYLRWTRTPGGPAHSGQTLQKLLALHALSTIWCVFSDLDEMVVKLNDHS
ncbi:hypothetical protein WN944_027943 [Citrus x changshan-huyou]|uniref:Uncharacterized protein n=1 Tax=Citrus x changshan-huyou TaxID=2935761 RepID=A0AAP0LKY4_9ROSI